MDEAILNVGQDAAQQPVFDEAMVRRTTDPVISSAGLPADFAAQYPTPLDPTEILAMCEEINAWRNLPTKLTGLKEETYREMTSLAFTSGSSAITFADYVCPEEYTHDGSNTTVTLKNVGAKKSLGISDIMHSQAIASAGWNGINTLVGPSAAFGGLPGHPQGDIGSFQRTHVADVKAKEMRLMATLVLNQLDRLLVKGNSSGNSLEFDGIETIVTTGNGAHVRSSTALAASGTFAASAFDQFLSEACAKPDSVWGHPQAVQELLSSYFQLWGAGTQVLQKGDGNRLTPGYNFASEVFTGVGTLRVIADANFTRTASGASSFDSSLYALRMNHNGEPLVYQPTQIPLAFKDLAPGCTAVSFMMWQKSALIIKARCAQSRYQSNFSGRLITTCPTVY